MWTTAQPVIHVGVGPDDRWRAPRFPVWAADIARTGWYGFPALSSGAMKIGHHGSGRRVEPDTPRHVLPAEETRVRAFLGDNLPPLADAPIVHRRLCLYCDTFDGDFWIDHDPERPGLVVAAGDSGHGFKFAPIIGGLIADVVEGTAERVGGTILVARSGSGRPRSRKGGRVTEIAHPLSLILNRHPYPDP